MKKISLFGISALIVLAGCSGAQKARKEEREKLVQSKGVFCDFVSESDFKDVDIELNLRLAKRCDASKPFSITNYKRVSENPGVLYCCNAEAGDGMNSVTNSTLNRSSDENQSDKKTPTPTTSK